ncbi:Las1-like protein, partial [Pavlovales sp. CCMP2436]
MLKHCPRLVPWTGWDEWNQVREWLYGDADACRRGLRRVEAWRSRGRVPVSVDATAAFVEARIADAERRARPASEAVLPGPSDTSVRLVYAMALTRFVNGVVDSGQKGAHARSVVSIGKELGLPSWFVELRHEATHNALPSLACLRLASEHALSWLHASYW